MEEMTKESQSTMKIDEDEISLKDFILKIRDWYLYFISKWFIIIIAVVVGSLAGFTYSSLKDPTFTATTTFVLEESGSNVGALGNLGGLASMAGIDIGGGGGLFQGDNIIELYKSRTMIQKALLATSDFNGKKDLLINRYIDFNDLKTKWGKTNWSQAVFTDSTKLGLVQDSVIKEIVKEINENQLVVSKLDKKLSIIRVDVKSRDELFAKAFSDEVVHSVNTFYIQTKTKRSLQNVLILQHKTDSVRAVMNGAIYTASAVIDATPNLNPTRQAQRSAPVQRSQFTAETNKAVLSELLKNLELSKITLLKETPLLQIIDQPVYPLEKEKFGKAKGIIFGGFLFGFFALVFLIINRILKEIFS